VLYNFISVNTTWNREKVVDLMKEIECEVVFLDLPEHFEAYIVNGIIPPQDFGYSQDLRACEPIVRFCWENGIPIYCYIETKLSKELIDIQMEIARLILKTKLKKKIDVKEWKKVILKDIEIRNSSDEYIEMKIRENAKKENVCLNLSRQLEKELEDLGVKRIVLYEFRRPIDKLYELASREINGEEVSDEYWLEAIERHIAFVDTVIEMGYEEACKLLWI